MTRYFDQYAQDYDRIQPVKIEMYGFYHQLALDLVPFAPDQPFLFADLGCGTGNFLSMVLDRFPMSKALGLDLSAEMLSETGRKIGRLSDRVPLIRHDLNDALPADLSDLDMIVAFSALHHLPDQRKQSIVGEIYSALKPGGWLLLADAMYVPYSEDVWSRGHRREESERSRRFAESGISTSDFDRYELAKRALDEASPERDRISSLEQQLTNLSDAGFASVDHVWQFWMEHLVIARK